MTPPKLTDEELMKCMDAATRNGVARAIESARDAQWETMLERKEEHDFWDGVCESLDMEIACWRVSYNNGKTWTIWETDPQPSMFDTKEGMIVHPLYVPKRYAESYPPQPAQPKTDVELINAGCRYTTDLMPAQQEALHEQS